MPRLIVGAIFLCAVTWNTIIALGQDEAMPPFGLVQRLEQTEAELDRVLQRLEQTEGELDRLREGIDELSRLPVTQASHLAGYDSLVEERLCEVESELCYLWNCQHGCLPYAEASTRFGDTHDRGQIDLFLPLIYSDSSLLFADLRGSVGDSGHHEGNWALACRHITCNEWILGAWASYDLRESVTGNNFEQISFGVEAMNYCWDFRLAGYVPDTTDFQLVGNPQAFIQANNIAIRSNQERAYWGIDGEVGKLLWSSCDCGDREVRGFVGGYTFHNPGAGFQSITGPRARVEYRLYDLPMLGAGSRLTLEGLIQYDQVRETQTEAALYVRIPFGRRPGCRPSTIQRRMTDRLVRDVDIVIDQQTITEGAKIAKTGQALTGITTINGAFTSQNIIDAVANAGADSIVIAEGIGGVIDVDDPILLNNGQTLAGQLSVVGCDTGVAATFTPAGGRPTINGTDTDNDVIEIADNTTVIGLDVTGGNDGIYGEDVTGFTLCDLNISGAAGHGVHFNGTGSGDVMGVASTGNGNNGFEVDIMDGGTWSNNTASGNETGYNVFMINGGTWTGNTASGNSDNGFSVSDFNGGIWTGNMASGNTSRGYQVTNFNGGTWSNNTASGNGGDGYFVFDFSDGTWTGNMASGNLSNGFNVFEFNGGTWNNNTASGNGGDGYFVATFNDGTWTGNTASGNVGFGYDLDAFNGGTWTGNSASGNSSGYFAGFFNGGTWTGNTASGNTFNGYNVDTFDGGTMSNNTASGNGQDGFGILVFPVANTANFSNNSSTNNGDDGYEVGSGTPQTGVGTNTGSGNTANDNF